jgi:DNA-binding CsgD family transcriptional regulator
MKNYTNSMISKELSFLRHHDGIKLVDCGSADSHLRVKHLLDLPFCVFFSDTRGMIQSTNDKNVEYCGFGSLSSVVGKTLKTVFTAETAHEIAQHDCLVIRSRRSRIFEENALRQDGRTIHALAIKLPWYDEHDEIKGIFGCSIIIDQTTSIAESLTIIKDVGLLNAQSTLLQPALYTIGSVKLSRREYECLYHTVRGKSAKQIAYHLKISSRTVEEYLSNVKIKMDVYSKNALIEKTIDYFMNQSVSL